MSTSRIRIKVCGITSAQDALFAADMGADALGFIFHPQSLRYIDPEEARLIIDQLPPFIDIVGVFVDKKRVEVEEIIKYCRLNYVQLHGQESPKYAERLNRFASPCEIIKAFRIGSRVDPEEFKPYVPYVRAFLLDTYEENVVGGTGRSFDWSLVRDLDVVRPCVLAGGLNADNISAALQAVQPCCVDVNSGVETSPGVKDHQLISAFVNKVRTFGNG
ncbi:MAG: phosphoribosylanthranilate isomerase [Desulfobulbaceae bacterium]|nr:phosphoribosylanthranilate isomerase [Desulfobulbaceae bacterium]